MFVPRLACILFRKVLNYHDDGILMKKQQQNENYTSYVNTGNGNAEQSLAQPPQNLSSVTGVKTLVQGLGVTRPRTHAGLQEIVMVRLNCKT